jgi:uncharacterized glyoxalase superfamily protein PhnB
MLANRSMPSCSVIPVLPYPDVDKAITWLCDAFGFTLRWRVASHRAQLNVEEGAVVVSEMQTGDAQSPSWVMVRVENVDSHHERATSHGAHVVQLPASHPYGERQYVVQDLAGHHWIFSETLADVNPAEWGATLGRL